MLVAIDIGGTNTRVGTLDEGRSVNYRIIDRFPTESSFQAQMDHIAGALTSLGRSKIRGIGISIGAQVAADGASVASSVNLPDYEHRPLVQTLNKLFKCPVRIAHDAVCGLIAETASGSLVGYDRCAYLTVSTGTGAAVKLRKSASQLLFSIEMGHQILSGNLLKCLCGQIGCLETITGGKQIEMRWGRPPSQIADPQFWSEFTDSLAIGIVNLAWLTRIDAIAVSGGIALNSPYLRQHLAQRVSTLRVVGKCDVLWSAYGEDAPLVGAALLQSIADTSILH